MGCAGTTLSAPEGEAAVVVGPPRSDGAATAALLPGGSEVATTIGSGGWLTGAEAGAVSDVGVGFTMIGTPLVAAAAC